LLEEQLNQRGGEGHITAAWVVRYAFRRLGFPTTIRCIDFAKMPWYPDLNVQVYIPSMNIVWVMDNYEVVVFRGESRVLWGLPHVEVTHQGRLPVWDAYVGGGKYYVDTRRR